MPKRVSSGPSRQPRKAKKRATARLASSNSPPVRAALPQRPVAGPSRPAPGRERGSAAPVVDYHYVVKDLKRVALTAGAMFAVLAILAVFLR